MTKSDKPIQQIDTSRSEDRTPADPDWAKYPAVGMDTETADGSVFAISLYDMKRGENQTLHNGGDILEKEDLIDFLTQDRLEARINYFFNIAFDAEAILSDLLLKPSLELLHIQNEAKVSIGGTGYKITYIRGKFMQISELDLEDNVKRTWEYYDIANVTMSGNLNNTAGEWIGEEKADENVDVERFSEAAYRKDNLPAIIQYVRDDARITAEIAARVNEIYEEIGIPMGRPISTGYIAAEYMRDNTDTKPGFNPSKVQSLSWDAFHGGRFEVFQKGAVGKVTMPDINSAYPDKMRQLPDLATCDVGYSTDIEDIREADWSVIRLTVSTNPDKKIQPFALKTDKVRFPILESEEITTIKQIFFFALENGYIEDYEIHEAVNIYETDATTYPFDFMENLYDQRKTWENDEGKYLRANGLKIVINSMYGKTAQTTLKQAVITGESDLEEITSDLNEHESIKSRLGRMIIEEHSAGRWFNPFFAAHITGLTRLQLHKTVEDLGLIDDVIMFATDSIMLPVDAFENSDFDDYMQNESDTYAERLGKWDYDAETGIGYVIGSGVYEVIDTDADFEALEADDVIKRGTRGFKEINKSIGSATLYDAMCEYEQSIPIENYRPTTVGEAVGMGQQDLSIEDIAKFRKTERDLSPDFDNKREWEHEATDTIAFELQNMTNANNLRENLVDTYGPNVLAEADNKGRTKVILPNSAPDMALDDAATDAEAARTEAKAGSGHAQLTDAEKAKIDFSDRGYFHATLAKAAILDEGVSDWTIIYSTRETVSEMRQIARREKQSGGLGGRRLDADGGEEITASQARQLEKYNDKQKKKVAPTAGLTMRDLTEHVYTSQPIRSSEL